METPMTPALLTLALTSQPAFACGGFFCGSGTTTTQTTTTQTTTTQTSTSNYGLVPVVQGSERILFQVNPDDTVTTYVEVAYVQNEDVPFAWIIPVPPGLDATQVDNVSAEMFNALELATAPQFTFTWTVQNVNTNTNYDYNYNYNYGSYSYGNGNTGSSGGCGGCAGSDVSLAGSAAMSSGAMSESASMMDTGALTTTGSQTLGVEVVADAVVGPFAIEVIDATDAVDFGTWLTLNGYDLPSNAVSPLQHYIDGGMQFLGVQLAPDVPTGPIDTLVFTYPAVEPMIPLILTAIASAENLPITAFVLANDPHAPSNWAIAGDPAPGTTPDGIGGTDYIERAVAAIDVDYGHSMVLEYHNTTEAFPDLGYSAFNDLITARRTLTRWRGDISPLEMTLDPVFSADPELSPYSNFHTIDLGEFDPGTVPYDFDAPEDPGDIATPTTGPLPIRWLLLLPLPLLGWSLRRRT
jgi:hypothetical protein